MAEARTLDARLPVHGRGLVGTPYWGLMCLFATEGIVFAYLIFSYAYLGSQGIGRWPGAGPPSLSLALPATALLVGSSFVLEWGKRQANEGQSRSAIWALGATILMGLAFAALELKEWSDKPFGFGDDAYSSIYFLLTGTHLAHVAVGLFALGVLFAWVLSGRVGGEHVQARALTTLYWHFVDVVWVFVFLTVYVSPRLT